MGTPQAEKRSYIKPNVVKPRDRGVWGFPRLVIGKPRKANS